LAECSSAVPRKIPLMIIHPLAAESSDHAVASLFFHEQHGLHGQMTCLRGILGCGVGKV